MGMNKMCIAVLATLWGIAIAANGLCQEKAKDASGQDGKKTASRESHKVRAGSSRAAIFAGTVVWADPVSKTLTVRGRGRVVTFDASSPTFRGYRGLEDVREGAYVAVSYTKTGVRISRTTRTEAFSEPSPEKAPPQKSGKKEPRKKMARIQQKGTAFCDVDENKDGKVTAVEMSVVMGDLTIEQFKQYDRNGDGCLSEAEYRAAMRAR